MITLTKLLILTGLCTAVSLFTGCPDPYTPLPTNSPTPIVSEKPIRTPKPTPTQKLDYVKISGKIESCENHGTGIPSTVAFYDTENSDDYTYSDPITIKGTGSNKTQTDSSGHFSVTLDKLVGSNANDKIYVRTVAGTESDIKSYTRTIDLPANQDHSPITDSRGSPAIRVVNYSPNWTPEAFKGYMQKINATSSEWDLDSFKGIKIFQYNGSSSFTIEKMTEIVDDAIKGPTGAERFVNGKELDDYVEVIYDSPTVAWENGYIYIVPDKNIVTWAYGIASTKMSGDYKIYSGHIRLEPTANVGVAKHELGHTFIAPDGEAGTVDAKGDPIGPLPPEDTIMHQACIISSPGLADEKAGKILYEVTYKDDDSYYYGLNVTLGSWQN